MWVRFVAPFEWKPKRSVTMVWKAGDTFNATKECAEAAIKAGAAVELRKTSKTADPVEVVSEWTVEHAQQLRERVTFQQRNDTGAPGAVTEWTTQFTLAARLKPRLTGSEDMIAGRMTGQQPYILTVRPIADPAW
jgi:hypothetical protein